MCNATDGRPEGAGTARSNGPRGHHALLTGATILATLTLVLVGCSGDDDGSEAGAPVTDTAPGGDAGAPSNEGGAGLLDVAAMGTVTGTDGRVYLADAQGRARQLRGANIKTEDPLDDASEQVLDDLTDRGFDVLRLSVYWHLLEPSQGSYDESYLEALGEVLDRAAERDLHVILSFHQDVFGPAFGFGGIPEWATRTDGAEFTRHDVWLANYLEPAVQNAWEHLYEDQDLRDAQAATWAMVAERFGDHPAVIGYDLLNEPFGKQRPDESLLEAASRLQATQLTDMYQRLVDAMRPGDPDGWMFVEAPNVASIGLPVTLGPIDDDRIVFFPHMYDADIETATYTSGEAELDLSFFETYEAVIRTYPEAHGVPMMVGEWGLAAPERPGMDTFVDESLALMDRVGSGWTVFTWCRGDGYCPIDAEGNDRPNIGRIVRPWARAIAGAPTSFAYDPEAEVLTVSFAEADATGPTEIVVPPGTYPDGWQVVTGDAEGSWEQSFDEATGVVSVTTPATGGDHVICLGPAGADLVCTAP